jgi:hypothetical protein
VLTLVVLAPAGASGQSLFARGGLGVPVGPQDGRARALGSVGMGLFGVTLTTIDPSAGYQRIPALAVTLQPTWGSFEAEGQSGDLQGQRFPILGFSYPTGPRGQVSLTYGTFMDQRWAVSAPDTVELAGQPTEVLDTFESNGGISSVRVAYAHEVSSGLVLAVNGGLLTGQVTRSFGREFDSTAVDLGVDEFEVEGRWRWIGPAAAVAARWDPNELIRVSASVNWYGTLEAQPQDSTPGSTVQFDLPLEFRTGASFGLTPELIVNGSFYYAGWETTGRSLGNESQDVASEASAATGFGGGVEWGGLGIAGKSFPLRFGYRWQELPFLFDGDQPVESSLSGGIGFNLAQAEGIVLAKTDIAVERGSRSAQALTERFWRISITFQAAGL